VSTLGLGLVVGGVVLLAIGLVRARGPWTRYRALKAQEGNIARYEAWRGGLRDTGPTGASVAMDMFRSQLRLDVAIALVGVIAIIAGIVVG
jgi:hypothetical protein